VPPGIGSASAEPPPPKRHRIRPAPRSGAVLQVVNRQPFDGDPYGPEPWESGRKDTVIAYPGEITRVKATFDRPGLFVWHRHIVEHEDHEMMRPYRIGPGPAVDVPVQVGAPGATKPKPSPKRRRKRRRARRQSSPAS
jgi:hypothetical protein